LKLVEITKAISQHYPPKARCMTQGFSGDESLFNTSYADIETLLEPVVAMYLTDPAPPPSHTIVIPVHPHLKSQQHQGQDLAFAWLFAIHGDDFVHHLSRRENGQCH